MGRPIYTNARFTLLPLGEKVGRASGSDEGYAQHALTLRTPASLTLPLIRLAPRGTFSPKGRRSINGDI